MDSNAICIMLKQPAVVWYPRAGVPAGLRSSCGIYVYRCARGIAFGRLKGKSDVVYIGRSSRPVHRSKQHARLRGDIKDQGWRLKLIESHVGLEIGFFPCGQPEEQERELLTRYFRDHLELPPANSRLEASSTSKKALVVLALIGGDTKLLEDEIENRKALAAETRHSNYGA